jgi:hypothetical protein
MSRGRGGIRVGRAEPDIYLILIILSFAAMAFATALMIIEWTSLRP